MVKKINYFINFFILIKFFSDFDGTFEDEIELNSEFNEDVSENINQSHFVLFKNQKNLLFGDNPFNHFCLLNRKGKQIFEMSVANYYNYNIYTTELEEIFFEIKNKSRKLMNIPKIENFSEEKFKKNEKKISEIPIIEYKENSINEASNIASSKDNEDFKINDLNNFEDINHNPFFCIICDKSFKNGQGLGGHMSRKHPNQSDKYKRKKLIRERRNKNREITYNSRRRLLERLNQDYDSLINSSDGRKLIKTLVRENKIDYLIIKEEVKKLY